MFWVKMKAKLLALVIFLVIVVICTTILSGFVQTKHSCEKVDDCTFVPAECCPGCDGYESVNKKYATDISQQFENCSKECPIVYCGSETGYSVIPVPVCENKMCSSTDELKCEVFCEYYTAIDQLSAQYVQNTANHLDTTPEQLAISCNC